MTSPRLRILFLLTQDLESPGGLGRYFPLARSLVNLGHHVQIAALHPNWDSLTERRFENEGVLVDYVAPMHVQKIGNQKIYYSTTKLIAVSARASWALSRAAMSAPVDIVHVGKPHPMNSLAGILARRLKNRLLCVDCDDYEAGSNRFGQGWQKSVVAYVEKLMPRLSNLVTTNTEFMQGKIISWGCPRERIFYLSTGIDRQRFTLSDRSQVTALRNSLHLEQSRVILFVGSLSLPSHPIDLLLKAFVEVHKNYPDTVLLLVGSGEDYQTLINMANDLGISQSTQFTGRVKPAEVPVYYGLADVSVDPVYDNDAGRGRSPMKLFESWASGVPFVSANVGDRQRILGQPPAGILAEPAGDPSAQAGAIETVLGSAELAGQLRERGLSRVENFYWDQLAVQLETAYQALRGSR